MTVLSSAEPYLVGSCEPVRRALVLLGLLLAAVAASAQNSDDCKGLNRLVAANFNGFRGAFAPPQDSSSDRFRDVIIPVVPFEDCRIGIRADTNDYPYLTCNVLPRSKPAQPFVQSDAMRGHWKKTAGEFVKDISKCLGVPSDEPTTRTLPGFDTVAWHFTSQATKRSQETGLVPTAYVRITLRQSLQGVWIESSADQPKLEVVIGRYDSALPLSSAPPLPARAHIQDFNSFLGLTATSTPAQVVALLGQPSKSDGTSTSTFSYMHYEAGELDETMLSVASHNGTGRVAIITVYGRSGADWLRQRGVNDPKLNLLGRHVDDIVDALGAPSVRKSERLQYSSKEKRFDVEFSCARLSGFACDELEVSWRR